MRAASARTSPACGANHKRKAAGPRGLRRRQRMGQHRPAADGMEHLRQVRAHAHALAGGKEDDQQGSIGHGALLIGALRVALPSVRQCRDDATIMLGPRKTGPNSASVCRAKAGPPGADRLSRHNAMASEAHVHNPGRPRAPRTLTGPPRFETVPLRFDLRRSVARSRSNVSIQNEDALGHGCVYRSASPLPAVHQGLSGDLGVAGGGGAGLPGPSGIPTPSRARKRGLRWPSPIPARPCAHLRKRPSKWAPCVAT